LRTLEQFSQLLSHGWTPPGAPISKVLISYSIKKSVVILSLAHGSEGVYSIAKWRLCSIT